MEVIMKIQIKILIGLIVIGLAFIGFKVAGSVSRVTYVAPEVVKPLVTHAQGVWISALEWCESRGKVTAINPKDRDNTPSYYSFQFKPGTFKYYGERYEVIEKELSNEVIMEQMKLQEKQKEIVEHMVADQKNIEWSHQFPDCVKKLGKPPVY